MVGFESKRMASMARHCDEETMDHIIELRKQLREMERQRDNALDRCETLDKLVWKLRALLVQGKTGEDNEEQNC